MSLNLDVQFDKAIEDALIAGLVAMPRRIKFARARALRKTGIFVRKQIRREAAKALNMPQKAISDRFFLSRIRPDDDTARLYIGTWNVDPRSLGTPAQTALEVQVGRRFYRGAFLAAIYSGQEKVWIRRKSKYYSAALYPVRKRISPRTGGMPAELRNRFPVIRAAVPIDAVLAKVVRRDEGEISSRFRKVLLQEINYEVNVRMKK